MVFVCFRPFSSHLEEVPLRGLALRGEGVGEQAHGLRVRHHSPLTTVGAMLQEGKSGGRRVKRIRTESGLWKAVRTGIRSVVAHEHGAHTVEAPARRAGRREHLRHGDVADGAWVGAGGDV